MMNDIYKEIIIDGELHSGCFRGIGLEIDKNMMRRLAYLKFNYPESYKILTDLLFNSESGAVFTHIKPDSNCCNAENILSDILRINPDISSDNSGKISEHISCACPQYAVNADGNGMTGEGSCTDIVKRIIEARSRIICFNADDLINTRKVRSGSFDITSAVTGIAHITAFSRNGWDYADGNLENDYMALSSADGDYSIFFVNDTDKPRKYSICIRCIGNAGDAVHCIETKGPENTAAYNSNWFRITDKILPVKKSYGYCYNVEVSPFSVMTCTTVSVDNVAGPDTFVSVSNQADKKQNYFIDMKNSAVLISDVSGCFEEYIEDGKTFIQQTEIHNEISEGEFACAVFGESTVSDCVVSTLAGFADDDEKNFVALALHCLEDGTDGYCLEISPGGLCKIFGSDNLLFNEVIGNVILSSPNKLEITASSRNLYFKVNNELVYKCRLEDNPVSLSGCAAVISAFRRNVFTDVKITAYDNHNILADMHDCLSDSLEYSKGWKKSADAGKNIINRTTVRNINSNEYFEFSFSGDRIALCGKTRNLRAKIELDDCIILAGEINDSGINQIFFDDDNIGDTQHNIRFTVLSGTLEFNYALAYSAGIAVYPIVKTVNKIHKSSRHSVPVKKSTLLIGAGIAAAGIGFCIIKKIFSSVNKKHRQKNLKNTGQTQ